MSADILYQEIASQDFRQGNFRDVLARTGDGYLSNLGGEGTVQATIVLTRHADMRALVWKGKPRSHRLIPAAELNGRRHSLTLFSVACVENTEDL